MKIDRLLSIIITLLNKEKVTAKELADKFEVNLRTIYRDIETINMAGIPIISYQGNNGGFSIMENYKLDHQLLSLNDMASMISALKSINLTLQDNEIDNTIGKINSIVPNHSKAQFENTLNKVVIDIVPWGFSENNKLLLKEIHKAVVSSKIISFDYSDMKLNKSRRSIEPMTLIIKGYSWYLFGYCLERNDYRLFKVLRIKNLKISERHFTRKNTNYKDYLDHGQSGPPRTLNVKLQFNKNMLPKVEEFFSEDEISIEDNRIIVNSNFPEGDWINSWILSFGSEVTVIDPPELRETIKATAKTILDNYR